MSCFIERLLQGFEEGVLRLLSQQPWETNLSQLKTFIQQSVLTAQDTHITLKEANLLLSSENANPAPEIKGFVFGEINLGQTLGEIEREIIQYVLIEENMNRSAAARRLGVSRNTIWRELRQ